MVLIEVSFDRSEALSKIANEYYDDDYDVCRDPFDILSAIEEENGYSLYSS